jgi:hypothetical protein
MWSRTDVQIVRLLGKLVRESELGYFLLRDEVLISLAPIICLHLFPRLFD